MVSQHYIQSLTSLDLKLYAAFLDHIKYMGNQVPLSFQIGFENGFAISENIALLIVIRFFQKHQASLCLRQALFDRESFDFVFRQSLLLEYLLNENLVLKFQITSPRVFTGCNAR